MCDKFYQNNDFKLAALNSFVSDHMTRHIQEWDSCFSTKQFDALPTNEDKDRAFTACHKKWVNNLKSNVSFDLAVRAQQIFGDQQDTE